jgi:hypothetical protein
MFQPGAVIENAGLVQFPCDCIGPSSNRAGVVTAVEVVVVEDDEPDPEVVVVDEVAPPAVVVVDCDPDVGAVVLDELDPAGGGGLYAFVPEVDDEPLAVR